MAHLNITAESTLPHRDAPCKAFPASSVFLLPPLMAVCILNPISSVAMSVFLILLFCPFRIAASESMVAELSQKLQLAEQEADRLRKENYRLAQQAQSQPTHKPTLSGMIAGSS